MKYFFFLILRIILFLKNKLLSDVHNSELSCDNQERKLMSSFFNFYAELNEFKYF